LTRMLALAAALCATAAGAAEVRYEAATPAGAVQIVEADFSDTRIVVDGAEVFRDTENLNVFFGGFFPDERSARYVLLQHNTGGTACPAVYRVLDLGGAVPAVSPEFGTCSDVAEGRLDGAALTVSMPDMRTGKAKAWVYADGRLAEARARPRAKAK